MAAHNGIQNAGQNTAQNGVQNAGQNAGQNNTTLANMKIEEMKTNHQLKKILTYLKNKRKSI